MAVRTITGTGATEERPSFLELLVPLVALSLGAVFAVAVAVAALFLALSMVL
jgi:hypothetical protein